MQIISKHRLEVLFKRTPYADIFRCVQNFKPRQIGFPDIIYNLDHILCSHTCREGVFILETLITYTLLFLIFQFFHHKRHLNYPNFFIQILYTSLILTLSQPHTVSNTLKNSLGWMINTSKLPNNSLEKETEYPHIIFSFARKEYAIAEFLRVFSADFLDFIYQHNVLPTESPFAAIRVSIPTLIYW